MYRGILIHYLSIEKRHYFGGYPPTDLAPPPQCALECVWVWWRAFNEAAEQVHTHTYTYMHMDTFAYIHIHIYIYIKSMHIDLAPRWSTRGFGGVHSTRPQIRYTYSHIHNIHMYTYSHICMYTYTLCIYIYT